MANEYMAAFKAGDFVRFELGSIQLVVVGVQKDHYVLRSRFGLLKEYFSDLATATNPMVRWNGPVDPEHTVQDSMYSWQALCPELQEIYSQALQELSQYGDRENRYYIKRLDRYVGEQEISKVATLEFVLWRLEVARDAIDAHMLLVEWYRHEYERSTFDRYVATVKKHAFPEEQ